jgi:hypothetical protein
LRRVPGKKEEAWGVGGVRKKYLNSVFGRRRLGLGPLKVPEFVPPDARYFYAASRFLPSDDEIIYMYAMSSG